MIRPACLLACVRQRVGVYLFDGDGVIRRIAGDLNVLAVIFCRVAAIDPCAVSLFSPASHLHPAIRPSPRNVQAFHGPGPTPTLPFLTVPLPPPPPLPPP